MNLSNTLRELLWENPMTLEATRAMRRLLRSGYSNETPYATRKLNRLLVGTLGFLYLWTVVGIVRSGEDMTTLFLAVECAVLTLIIPCSFYGAIAVEREKQTYESLILTRLTPTQIICGKLWWRVGLIAGLMALFAPFLVLSQFAPRHGLGDYTVMSVVWSQVVVFCWSLLLAAFSLFVSARSKKGITALLGIVAAVIAFVVLVPALSSMFGLDLDRVSPGNPLDMYNRADGASLQIEGEGGYIQSVIGNLASSLLTSLHPVVLLFVQADNNADRYRNTISLQDYWLSTGIRYWGVAVYIALTGVCIRAAIKTLRGLEMPIAEKVRRARFALNLGKKGA